MTSDFQVGTQVGQAASDFTKYRHRALKSRNKPDELRAYI